jgi:hypothetical protein
MFGCGGGIGSARRLTSSIVRASPRRRWGRKGSSHGAKPERILDVDLVPRTNRFSRMMDSEDRRVRSLAPWWALLVVVGVGVAFLLSRVI